MGTRQAAHFTWYGKLTHCSAQVKQKRTGKNWASIAYEKTRLNRVNFGLGKNESFQRLDTLQACARRIYRLEHDALESMDPSFQESKVRMNRTKIPTSHKTHPRPFMLVILFTSLATTVQIAHRQNFKWQATMRDVTLAALNAYRSTIKPPLMFRAYTTGAVSPQIFRVPPLPRK